MELKKLLFVIIVMWDQTNGENSVAESVAELCQTLVTLDSGILKKLEELQKNGGDAVVKDMAEYNTALMRLETFLNEQRNTTLGVEKAAELLKEGAPDYFGVNIDHVRATLNFGWLDKGLGDIFSQRAASIKIWSRLNRMSRLIPLEFYSYPENATYTGYKNPIFPPLKEKLSRGP